MAFLSWDLSFCFKWTMMLWNFEHIFGSEQTISVAILSLGWFLNITRSSLTIKHTWVVVMVMDSDVVDSLIQYRRLNSKYWWSETNYPLCNWHWIIFNNNLHNTFVSNFRKYASFLWVSSEPVSQFFYSDIAFLFLRLFFYFMATNFGIGKWW